MNTSNNQNFNFYSSDWCKSTFLEILRLDINELCITGIVVISLAIPPTVLLNALVLVGIYKNPSLHTPSNVLLFSLAFTDLGTGAVALPLNLIAAIGVLENVCFSGLHETGFMFVGFFIGLSFITLTLISVDRVIALQFHMRYASIVTIPRVLAALAFSWGTMILIMMLYFWIEFELLRWIFAIAVVVCLIVSSVNNYVILRILRRHRVDIERQQQQVQMNQNTHSIIMAQRRKTSSKMLWVYLLFVVCYAPHVLIAASTNNATKNGKILRIPYIFIAITNILLFLNSMLNPIFYCISMRSIRRRVLRLLPSKFLHFFPDIEL